jgi:hypothetical protein
VARMRLWHLQTTRGLGGAQGRARSCAQLPATKSLFLGNQEKDFFSQKFCFMGGAKRTSKVGRLLSHTQEDPNSLS